MRGPRAPGRPSPADHIRTVRPTSRSIAARRWVRAAPLAVLFLGASVFVAAFPAQAAQGPVGLGTATSFAVLAGSGITNTGPTTITGDVGTFPTPSETGFGSVTLRGTDHAGDAVTQGAKADLVTAYDDTAGRGPVTNAAVELGGTTKFAGVYTSGTFGLTGTLTLDAQGVTSSEFIFQAASTLITATNSRVLLLNGADPCRVVWQVGSSATFNTATAFVGDVLANTSITAETGASFQGRLLALNGAVTMDTNTIANANCGTGVPSVGATATTVLPAPATTGSPTTTRAPSVTTPGSSPTGGSGGTPPHVPAAAAAPIPSGPGSAPPTSPPHSPPVRSPGGPPAATPGAPLAPIPGGPPNATPGTPPAATPGGPPSATPGTPPLARTGWDPVGLLGTAIALLAVGALLLAAQRRYRRDPAA